MIGDGRRAFAKGPENILHCLDKAAACFLQDCLSLCFEAGVLSTTYGPQLFQGFLVFEYATSGGSSLELCKTGSERTSCQVSLPVAPVPKVSGALHDVPRLCVPKELRASRVLHATPAQHLQPARRHMVTARDSSGHRKNQRLGASNTGILGSGGAISYLWYLLVSQPRKSGFRWHEHVRPLRHTFAHEVIDLHRPTPQIRLSEVMKPLTRRAPKNLHHCMLKSR